MTTEELAIGFMALFQGLDRAYGEYRIPPGTAPDENGKLKGKAATKSKPVTKELWVKHLSGELGLGIVPIREDGTCSWGALDLDFYENFDHAGMERRLERLGLPLVTCRTKSGGCHLYLFLTEPTKASAVRKKLLEFEMALGFANSEIFPKQDKITSEKDFGNWINVPYQKALLTTRYAFRDGKAVKADEFIEFAKSRSVTPAQLTKIKPAISEEFSDAPPCLQQLANVGFPPGSRNNALFSLGVYAKRKWPEDWEERVFDYNTRYMGPGTYAEVQGLIRSLNKKGTYVYKCSDQPICGICNKTECRKREFGISSSRADKGSGPCILDDVDRPVKCYIPPEGVADEPQWVFKIAGKTFDVTVDMVRDQSRFLREYLKKFQRLLLPVKEPKWVELMNELLEEATIVELPPDAGPEGQLWLHIEQFCTGKVQARAQEELSLGKPWTDGGRTYFRSKDLMKYLDQQHFREFKEKEIWAILRRHNASHHKLMIRGLCVGCWSLEAFERHTEDLTMPLIEKKEEPF